jgi:hypothetical protein
MPKLTDEQLGELLRETFADRETLVDNESQVPEATKPRRLLPALLAAAAVVAVLGVVLYGVQRAGGPSPATAPPKTSATTTPSESTGSHAEDGLIWGVAIAAIVRQAQPAHETWQAVEVFGQIGYPGGKSGTPQPSVTFPAAVKQQVEQAVMPLAPVRWNQPISPSFCVPGRIASVTVAPVVYKRDHQEVQVDLRRGCVGGTWGTSGGTWGIYSLKKVAGTWKIVGATGTLTLPR